MFMEVRSCHLCPWILLTSQSPLIEQHKRDKNGRVPAITLGTRTYCNSKMSRAKSPLLGIGCVGFFGLNLFLHILARSATFDEFCG